MKKFKIFCMTLIMATTFSTSAFAEEAVGKPLDLNWAIDSAIKNSYEIKNRENAIKRNEDNFVDEVKSAGSLEERVKINDRFIKLANKSERTPEEEEDYKFYVAVYGSPLGDEEVSESLKMAGVVAVRYDFNKFQNENALNITKNKVKEDVYEKYGEILKENDKLELEKRKLGIAKDEFEKVKLSSTIGAISKLEGKEKEVEYLKAKESYDGCKRDFDIERRNFNKLIGVTMNTEYNKYLQEYSMGSTNIKSYEEYLKEALENRAEIINGKEYIEVKRYERSLAIGVYYDGHREAKIADSYFENAKDMLELKKLDLQLEIKKLYDDIEVKNKNFQSILEDYKEAKRNYDETSKRYSLGMISKLEYNKRSAELFEKIVNYRNIERDLYMAKLKLENACLLGTDESKAFYSNMD